MIKSAISTVAFALLAFPALAAPTLAPRDVPAGHWAAGSVRRVTAARLMTTAPNGDFNGNKPVTRYELAVTLDRLVRYIEASHKPLSAAPPRPVAVPAATPAAAAAALKHLVGSGYLTRKSPLLKPPGTQIVTANELADALSQVTIRLSDRSLPPYKP